MKHLVRVLAILTGLAFAGAAHAVPFPDGDDDGLVDFDEARRVFSDLAQVHFEKFDNNHDGELTRGEFAGLSNFYSLIYRDR